MSVTHRLFERWKAHRGIPSDRAGMIALGLSPTAAQHWKAGRNASIEIVERMARDLGEDYVSLVVEIFKETAPSQPEKKFWRELAKRSGAAALLGATLLTASAPEPSYAATGSAERYIMRTVKPGRRTRKPRRINPGTFPDSRPVAGPAPCRPFRRSRRHGRTALHHPRPTPQRLRPPALPARRALP